MIEGKDDDFVKVAFSDFVLSNICETFIPTNALTLSGELDGLFCLKGLHDTPHFDANLVIENCVINNEPAGRVELNSNYIASEKKLFVDLVAQHDADGHHHRPIELHGNLLLGDKTPKLDFALNLDEVRLQTLRPTIAEVMSNIEGNVSGSINLQGTFEQPMLHGNLSISDGLLQLVPTGVTYYFNDSFTIDNNTLTLRNFAIHDKLANTIWANGALRLSTTDIVDLDLDVNTDRILLLDKEANESNGFFGKLLAQVKGSVKGPVNNLAINATASTLNGSDLYVPIDNSKQVQENEFITFLSPDRTQRPRTNTNTTTATPSNIDLRVNLHVTPGLKLHLPMDFDQLGANVNAVGRGDIQVNIQDNQPPNILGDYEFTSGNFSLSLLQLITRNFTIEEGSTLNFPGNINDARFNISAAYNLRTNLATLMANNASTTNDSYVQIQDVIQVSGTLQDPSIKFDIRVPNSEQSVSEQVFSYLDRNNELEMLNQSISLLVLGQFTPSNTSSQGGGEGFNSVNLVANTAGSIITSMVKVVDVDFKYQASNSNLNPMGQFDVGISKSWNKFYFESTFGYGNVNSMDIDQSNTIVGDVKVGYKFNPYFKFSKEDLKLNKSIIVKTVKLGVPLSLQFSLIAISCMALQSVVNTFGAVTVAAFTATSRIEQIIHQPYQTLSAALSTFCGQNYGAGKNDRVIKGYHRTLLLMVIFTAIMVPLIQIFGKQITSIFVDEAEVIEMGAKAMQITSLFYVFLGLIYVVRGILNGLGDAFFALLNGIVEIIGRFTVPILFVSIPAMGLWGIWWSVGVVWFLSGFTAWLRYKFIKNKKIPTR